MLSASFPSYQPAYALVLSFSEGSGCIFIADPNMFKQARVMQTSIFGSVHQCFYVNQA